MLETLGELTAGRSKDFSALSEIRRARAPRPSRARHSAWRTSRPAFWSNRSRWPRPGPWPIRCSGPIPVPRWTMRGSLRAGGATGHVHLAARLQRRAAPDYTFLTPEWEEVTVPLQLTDAALGLFAYSAFGTPMDSLAALEQRVERLIPSYVEPAKRAAPAGDARRPGGARLSGAGLRPMHRAKAGGNYRLAMQWELARETQRECGRNSADHCARRPGDSSGRRRLRRRPTMRPGCCSPWRHGGGHTAAGDPQCASDTGRRPAGSAASGGDASPGYGPAC